MDMKEYVSHGVPVTWTHLQTAEDSKMLGRPCGHYITLDTGPLDRLDSFDTVCACLADQLRPLLEPCFGKILCVCGLGNQDMVSDSLGPEVARRFRPKLFESFVEKSNFEKVVIVCPGVNGYTNLSSEKIVASVASAINAACILAVDCTSCTDLERLCSSISLTDNGMHSYWGTVDLRESTMGIPVVTIGVPTMIGVSALFDTGNTAQELHLTTLHIPNVIQSASFIIACAIAQVAFPELDFESCKQYIGLFLNNII